MKILIVISNPESTEALIGLSSACSRRDQTFFCFFTGDGVKLFENPDVITAVFEAERAVVCEYSWAKYFPDQHPPIEEGSQTDHSAMIGLANQVISL